MEHRLDKFSKLLAAPLPRREALRRMGGLVAGAFLGLFGLAKRAEARDLCTVACQQRGCNRVASAYVTCVLTCRKLGIGAVCGCGVCPAGTVCQAGKCVTVTPCRGIGVKCAKGTQCCSGSCGANLGPGTVCCVPNGGPCDLNNPGACCSLTCEEIAPNPQAFCIP